MKTHTLKITDSKLASKGECSCGAVWSVPSGPSCWVRLHELHKRHTDLAMKQDPLVSAMRRARKGNPVDVLTKILEQETFWKRRETIARNQLAKVRAKLQAFAKDRAKVTVNNPVLPL